METATCCANVGLGGLMVYQVYVRNHSHNGTLDAVTEDIPRIARLILGNIPQSRRGSPARADEEEGRLGHSDEEEGGVGNGVGILYLLPHNPPGVVGRKGAMGSPYAIRDYRAVDPALIGGKNGGDFDGTGRTSGDPPAVHASDYGMPQFRRLVTTAHANKLLVIIDVVFAHTSPDSVLAREHPEWFVRNSEGKPIPVVDDWTDVVSFDYNAGGLPLAEYLIEGLQMWVDAGVNGFRCDVAGAVPLWFWRMARERLGNDLLWIAETSELVWVENNRIKQVPYPCDCQMLADSGGAFDLLYDYDIYDVMVKAIQGRMPIKVYLERLRMQSLYLPPGAHKLRYVENHDKPRIASLVSSQAANEAWTSLVCFLPGAFMIYGGQEAQEKKRPSLFDNDPVEWSSSNSLENFLQSLARVKALIGYSSLPSESISSSGTVKFYVKKYAPVVVAAWYFGENKPGLVGVFNTAQYPSSPESTIDLSDVIKDSTTTGINQAEQMLTLNPPVPHVAILNGSIQVPSSAYVMKCQVLPQQGSGWFYSESLDYDV
ncbi:alpha amylase [Pelomyxa schiedti]|nr:alpha amylase [Pelomyxa schiedti]